jgi:hypothetical protein
MKRIALVVGLSLAGSWGAPGDSAAAGAATPAAPVLGGHARSPGSVTAPIPAPGALCAGGYSDDFSVLSAQARDFDRRPEAAFSYCTRNTAVYECLSYRPDGAIRRQRRQVTLHGTAFAYRRQAGDTLLLTNDHVGSWPAVTDPQHLVEGVPSGCKRVAESLALVDDEHDAYGMDDIPVTRVASDPQLDIAVLRAREALHVMPWKIGKSAEVRERNAVEVRGFPLGAFRATSLGKVISEHDHDDYGEWDHDDFVVDALLSSGNSGSPVLAVSCATGEYELVGIFHAGYTQGSALNVVVGIDQVRDLMTTLKRTPREHVAESPALDGSARRRVAQMLAAEGELFFPFGGNVAVLRAGAGGALLFEVFARDFPFTVEPTAIVEDLTPLSGAGFGTMGRVWFGSPRGLKVYTAGDSANPAAAPEHEPDLPTALALDALRGDAVAYVDFRRQQRDASTSRQTADRIARAGKVLARTAASRAELLQALSDAGERFGPAHGDPVTHLAEILAPPPAVRPPAAVAPLAPSAPAAP